eukprot:gene6661-3326_t
MSSDDDEGATAWPTHVPMISIPTIGDSSEETTDDDELDVSQILFSGLSYPTRDAKPADELTSPIPANLSPVVENANVGISNFESEPDPEEEAEGGLGSGWLLGAAARLADLSSPRIRRMLDDEAAVGLALDGGNTEDHISQRFHSIIAETEEAPLEVAAPGQGLTLEGGLDVDDLDALIARLEAGAVDLSVRPRPSYLPDPSTLFSDEEEDTPPPQKPATATTMARQPAPAPQAPVAKPMPPQAKPTALVAPPPGPPGPMPPPGMMMPAKFKAFAMPPMPGPSSSAAPPADLAADGTEPEAAPLRPTVKLDLRQEVAEVAARVGVVTRPGGPKASETAAVGDSDSDSDDEDDWVSQRKALKAGAPLTTSTAVGKVSTAVTGSPPSKPASTAKAATTSTSTGGTNDVKLVISESELKNLPRVAHKEAPISYVGEPKPVPPPPARKTASHSSGHDADLAAAGPASSSAEGGQRPPETDATCDTEHDLGPAAYVHHSSMASSLGPGRPGPGAVRVHEEGWMSVPAGSKINLMKNDPPQPGSVTKPLATTPATGQVTTSTSTSTTTTTTPAAPAQTSSKASVTLSPPAASLPPTQAASQPSPPTPRPPPVSLPSPTATANRSRPEPSQVTMPRLPAWVQATGCITLALSCPEGLPTHKVAALCKWLLAAGPSPSADKDTASANNSLGPVGGLGASVTIASLMLARLSVDHPLVKAMPQMAAKAVLNPTQQMAMSQMAAKAVLSPAQQMVSVLLLACVPGRIDIDLYHIYLLNKAAQVSVLLLACVPGRMDIDSYHTHRVNKAAQVIAATAVKTALANISWTSILHPGAASQLLASSSADKLSSWSCVIEGAETMVQAETTFCLKDTTGCLSPSPSPRRGATSSSASHATTRDQREALPNIVMVSVIACVLLNCN